MNESSDASFDKNVFINCPYDEDYRNILLPILFVLVCSGLQPLLASMRKDADPGRLSRIIEYIKASKYSIHDLSRTEVAEGKYPRFNMPFELGLDEGCRKFGGEKYSSKVFLVLEGKKYLTDRVLSDIKLYDPKSHDNQRDTAISIVRDWVEEILVGDKSGKPVMGTNYSLQEFSVFQQMNNKRLTENGFSRTAINNRSEAFLIGDMQAYVSSKNV